MPIDFHDEQNRHMYAAREVNEDWEAMIQSIVAVKNKEVADIGCGGGIYTTTLADMGAARVTGVDSSKVMLAEAQSTLVGYNNISYVLGNALNTGLLGEQYDIILERALVHHFKREDLRTLFFEAFRLLKPGGVLIVQDRTPEDCLLPGSRTHIRGYFFMRYSVLRDEEVARRHESTTVKDALRRAGFQNIVERQLWETRARYKDFAALADDLLARTGRSILHELTDEELRDLVGYIQEQFAGEEQEIVEQDRWTIWSTVKA